MYNWIKYRTAATLLGALLAAACVPTSGDYRSASIHASTLGSTLGPAYAVAPASRGAATRRARRPAVPDPDMLIGLDTSELETLLGNADLRRRDPPAQVWQYADKDCVLHLFLYENDGGYRVEHYEARGPNGAKGAGGVCLAGLMNASHHRSSN